MKKVALNVLIICILVFLGCEKNTDNKTFKPATVQYLGDPAVDGCGWTIKIENVSYSPKELSTEFQSDGLNVLVIFHLTNKKSSCGFNLNAFDEISIDDIKKQ